MSGAFILVPTNATCLNTLLLVAICCSFVICIFPSSNWKLFCKVVWTCAWSLTLIFVAWFLYLSVVHTLAPQPSSPFWKEPAGSTNSPAAIIHDYHSFWNSANQNSPSTYTLQAILFFALFGGILRCCLDTASTNLEEAQNAFTRIVGPVFPVVWLLSASIFEALFLSKAVTRINSGAIPLVVLFYNALFLFTVMAWLHTCLKLRFVKSEKVELPLRTLCAFLCSLMRVPVQVLLIGPKLVGKTKMFEHFTGEAIAAGTTVKPNVSTWERNATKTLGVEISVVDMVGENLGNHIQSVKELRVDALIVVLALRAFDMKAIDKAASTGEPLDGRNMKHIDIVLRVGSSHQPTTEVSLATKDYLHAFNYATNGYAQNWAQCKRLVLVINMQDPENCEPGTTIERLDPLGESGKRFFFQVLQWLAERFRPDPICRFDIVYGCPESRNVEWMSYTRGDLTLNEDKLNTSKENLHEPIVSQLSGLKWKKELGKYVNISEAFLKQVMARVIFANK